MMAKKIILAVLIALAAVAALSADMRFSIRYYDKNIYYTGDTVDLKITISNISETGAVNTADESFYLADDLRQSFAFELRNLTGDPAALAEGYTAALNMNSTYRIITLSPGQELSMTVSLNDWVSLKEADQYRLSGYFYPRLRGRELGAFASESVLDLTLLPETNRRWEDELSQEIRWVLINRNLDPWSIVRETFDNRSKLQSNRAILYLDIDSLTDIFAEESSDLKQDLLEGKWDILPGFEYPALNVELISSQIFENEASVRIRAAYAPLGERFTRQYRIYLHKKNGYWSIRRMEAVNPDGIDPKQYGTVNLEPPEVVSELIRASIRGDWDIALRYYDTEDIVRNLPENQKSWNEMSAVEHQNALTDYRERLLSGRLDDEKWPLKDLEQWNIVSVNYTDVSGTVIVRNNKIHPSAEGPLTQQTLYTFRLVKTRDEGRWIVVRYDTVRVES